MKLTQSREAVRDLLHRRYPHYITPGPSSSFEVDTLQTTTGHISSIFRSLLTNIFTGRTVPVMVRSRSIGTQTDNPDYDDGDTYRHGDLRDMIVDDDFELPMCEKCQQQKSVMGPIGTRRHSRFAQYYIQCEPCDKRYPSKNAIFYRLGVTPRYPSISNRPRNMVAIQDYVRGHT